MRCVVVFGSTGSIGTQALDIIRQFPDKFSLGGISGFSNMDCLVNQANEFKPPVLCVHSLDQRDAIIDKLNYEPQILIGPDGLIEMSQIDMDILLMAIVGTAALPPIISALGRVSHIAIANKEVLVAAGDIIMDLVRKHNTTFIPVDSEHSALFQCLGAVDYVYAHVKQLTLTASGGPFWNRDPNTFSSITPEAALKHPNWDMGAKITIDSATMMNKGLEVIEAHYLFDMSYDDISVVVHPKSIVHSFVETIDGAIFAHMGRPDMRYPIQYAMTYPNRIHTPWAQADITQLSGLEFFEPNYELFPLLKLAFDCGREGGVAPLVFNAANEVAVEQFLTKKIHFMDIFDYIKQALDQFSYEKVTTIDDVIELDKRIKLMLRLK